VTDVPADGVKRLCLRRAKMAEQIKVRCVGPRNVVLHWGLDHPDLCREVFDTAIAKLLEPLVYWLTIVESTTFVLVMLY